MKRTRIMTRNFGDIIIIIIPLLRFTAFTNWMSLCVINSFEIATVIRTGLLISVRNTDFPLKCLSLLKSLKSGPNRVGTLCLINGQIRPSLWTRLQISVRESSTEAEFYCLAEACRELLWIQSFLREIDEISRARRSFKIKHRLLIWFLTKG